MSTLQGVHELEVGLRAIFDAMTEFPEYVYDKMGEIGIESIKRNFEEGGRWGSGTFGGGTEKWVKSKWPNARTNTGGKMLQDNGTLRDSIVPSRDGRSLVWGSNFLPIKPHNEGMRIFPRTAKRLVFRVGPDLIFAKFVDIPRRPILVLQDEDIDDMVDVVLGFIRDVIDGGK